MEQRWLFSPKVDLGVFAGSALASAALVLLAPALGIAGDTPLWAWVVLVLCIDVAHVWSTLFRVYLDGDELRRRPLLYAGAPLLAWAIGVSAYSVSSHLFWRLFAYAAAWHFVKQQVGWMVLYGRRARSSESEIRLDQAAIYAATLGPVVWWHANLPRPFWWFVEGDFIGGLPAWVGTAALAIQFVVLGLWVVAQLRSPKRVHRGKALLLLATWIAWFGGIVLARSDFAFTAMNVVLHGIPYFALLYQYAKGRHAEGGYGGAGWILRAGLPGFFSLLVGLAFLEEFFWDRMVWHERGALFGSALLDVPEGFLVLLVPMLALPQATHYLLDGFIWRGRDDPKLAARLGWA
jgi:hypothetical protein